MSDEKSKRENKAVVPKRDSKVVLYRYKGGGFLPGVPARDLSVSEAEAIGRDMIEESPLYERVEES